MSRKIFREKKGLLMKMESKVTRGQVIIREERCKGCGLCVVSCPMGCLKLSETLINKNGYYVAVFDQEAGRCTACSQCAIMCPDMVIEIIREE